MQYDPARNAVNPNPVDYLLPEDESPVRPVGFNYGGYGGTGGYGGNLNSRSYAMNPVPKYTSPNVSNAPSYSASFREMPTYSAPAWNESEIDALSQKRAAPGLRQLRQQIQRVTGRRYDNPQVGRMTLRDALQGYGSGVGQVVGQADVAAAGEYGQKYARTSENARAAYASQAAQTDAYNRNAADTAKMNYGSSFAQWQAQNSSNARMAEMNYEGALAKWKAETEIGSNETAAENAYKRQQRGFEEAWERWKRQQVDPSVPRYSPEGVQVVTNRGGR